MLTLGQSEDTFSAAKEILKKIAPLIPEVSSLLANTVNEKDALEITINVCCYLLIKYEPRLSDKDFETLLFGVCENSKTLAVFIRHLEATAKAMEEGKNHARH